uniref:Uncharacterized protein n=1 Tax=Ciona savignyi TaxID=51511 RepID=H2ZB21_CIOSA
MFGSSNNSESDGSLFNTNRNSQAQTPYLNINPHYLTEAEEYILPEDASDVRSRAQTMFSMIGTAAVTGATIGGFESLRYSGLQWLKGKSQRMMMTSAVLKNGGQMAQRFGSVAVLYCACSIFCEKIRGVDDELNTLVGGATAGALYSLPGVFNVKKHGPQAMEEETIGFLKKTVRRLPPVGRFFFGIGSGLTLGAMLSLYRTSGPDFVREITRRT